MIEKRDSAAVVSGGSKSDRERYKLILTVNYKETTVLPVTAVFISTSVNPCATMAAVCVLQDPGEGLGLLQGAIFSLVASHNGLEGPALLPQLGHLRPQCRVLALQECRAHRDLVLLQAPGVTGTLGRHVVLVPPLPVLLVLRRKRKGRFK